MNRTEFCEMMQTHRKQSGVPAKQICFAMNTMPTDIYRIEKGYSNTNLNKIIDFLKATNGAIELSNDNDCFVINDYSSFIEWLINIRTSNNYTQRSLADAAGCSYAAIANTERQNNVLSIDVFLKLMDVLGYTIKITNKL